MVVRKLTTDSPELTRVKQINEEAFPSNERMDLEDFAALANKQQAEILAFEDHSDIVGFAVTMSRKSTTYVLYFAIDASCRSQGYGGQALDLLKQVYAGELLCLDMEPLNAGSSNAAQRERRWEFYRRHGFERTDVSTMLQGNIFEVLCFGGPLNEQELAEIVEAIHSVVPQFDSRIILGEE